jgi:hypothetical protein
MYILICLNCNEHSLLSQSIVFIINPLYNISRPHFYRSLFYISKLIRRTVNANSETELFCFFSAAVSLLRGFRAGAEK